MPRPRNLRLRNLFEVINDNIICKNGLCNGKMLSQHAGNLERHLRSLHPEIYKKYMKYKEEANKKEVKDVIAFKFTISCTVSKNNIETAIVELFTKSGRPLHMAEDSSFQILVKPIFDALKIKLDENYIMEMIRNFSFNLKDQISKELAGKLLSLKVDAATRRNLSVLGINVQYINTNHIVTKTLGIKVLEQRHTSDYLKTVILDVLSEYNIDLNQILTITKDTGANMIQTVNDISDEMQADIEYRAESTLFNEDLLLDNVTCVPCGAYTLQLCINNVLNENNIREKLDKIRAIVKQLKTTANINDLKTDSNIKLILDCPTKWNTTYLMLQRLIDLKEFIIMLSIENTALEITNEDWNFIADFLNVFETVYAASLKLQTENLIYSDLYMQILNIIIKLENLPDSLLKSCLLKSLNKRKCVLIEMDLFVTAVYLDPRIKVSLSADQILKAKSCVLSIHKRLLTLQENDPNDTTMLTSTSASMSPASNRDSPMLTISKVEPSEDNSMEEEDALENYLKNLDQTTTSDPLPTHCIQNDMLLYEYQCRLGIHENIIEYWNQQNNALSVVAKVVLGIPCTQVSIERVFSALKYILSDEHNNLSLSNLEDIFLVRANGEFHYEEIE